MRVFSQFCTASLDDVDSYAECLAKWMKARSSKRIRHHPIPGHCRQKADFWCQLNLARKVAKRVQDQYPNFRLWENDCLFSALQLVGKAGLAHEGIHAEWEKVGNKARAMVPNFELSPLWLWLKAHFIHILDFTCRLLESHLGIDEEYILIAQALPQCKPMEPFLLNKASAEILSKCLQKAWSLTQEDCPMEMKETKNKMEE